MASLNSHSKALAAFWQGEIIWDTPMSQFSTLKVGGPAEAMISVENLEDLKKLLLWLQENRVSWWLVGRGSNILVPDQGLAGVAITLDGDFISIEKMAEQSGQDENCTCLRIGGGCLLTKVVHYCMENGLSGMEFAVGIPGSVGGAVVMNAGAWTREIGDLINSATLMSRSGEVFDLPKKKLGFSYRGWSMEQGTILLYATIVLTKGDRETIKAVCHSYQESRKNKQPLTEPSAGSFFKNPPDHSAGRLIDEAGLKGHSIGGAKISEKHANFIVNTGSATAADILELMHLVQETVFEKFGIRLEPEVHILGEEG